MKIERGIVWLVVILLATVACGDDGTGGVDIEDESECEREDVEHCFERGGFQCVLDGADQPTCECGEGEMHYEEWDQCLSDDHWVFNQNQEPSNTNGSNDPDPNNTEPNNTEPNNTEPNNTEPNSGQNTNNDQNSEQELSECPVLEPADVVGGTVLSANSCHRVEEGLVVESGVLTIEEGVRIGFESAADLTVTDGGQLDAVGAAGNEIEMLPVEEQQGHLLAWQGVHFEGTKADNVIEHTVIETVFGGHSATGDGFAVTIWESDVTVQNTVIRDVQTGLAIIADSDDDPSNVDFDQNRIEETYKAPIELAADHAHSIGPNNEFVDTAYDAIAFQHGSGVHRDATLPDVGIPYFAGENLPEREHASCLSVRVDEGVTWTIEPGVTIEFGMGPSCQVSVRGDLVAEGQPGEEILFTTMDELPAEAPQRWYGIEFYHTDSVIRHAVVEEMDDLASAIHMMSPSGADAEQATLLIEHTVLRNASYGLDITNPEAEVLSCDGLEFEDIENDDIRSTSGDTSNICGGD